MSTVGSSVPVIGSVGGRSMVIVHGLNLDEDREKLADDFELDKGAMDQHGMCHRSADRATGCRSWDIDMALIRNWREEGLVLGAGRQVSSGMNVETFLHSTYTYVGLPSRLERLAV